MGFPWIKWIFIFLLSDTFLPSVTYREEIHNNKSSKEWNWKQNKEGKNKFLEVEMRQVEGKEREKYK